MRARGRDGEVMRKLIYLMMVSLDGFVETPERSLDWVQIDEEVHSFVNDRARGMSAFLYGRRMYELMTAGWVPVYEDQSSVSPAEADFSRIWHDTPKVVFSNTLESVGHNSTLVRGDAAEEVERLKAQPGADMGVGGADLAGSLIRQGLVDEFDLYVNPVMLGSGKRMLPELESRASLRLLETRAFECGVVFLRYSRA